MTRHIEPFAAAPDALNYRIMYPDQGALANIALEPSRPLSVVTCHRGARLSATVRPQEEDDHDDH